MNRKLNITTDIKTKRNRGCQSRFTTVCILADKFGSRMKSYGPTPLLDVSGSLLIDCQIRSVMSVFKNCEIIICAGADALKLHGHIRSNHANKNIRIVENQIFKNSNSCESLRLCLNNTMNTNVFIVCGDVLFTPKDVTGIKHKGSFIVSQSNLAGCNFEIGASFVNYNDVRNLQFGIENLTWSEIAYVSGEAEIYELKRFLSSIESKNKFVFEGINHLIKRGYKFKSFETKWSGMVKINNAKTLQKVQWQHDSGDRRLFG